MPALAIAVLTFVASLASGVAGLALARALPESPAEDRSRALIAGVAALTGLMLALTLASSISSASAFAQTQKAALQRLAADALAFDLAARRLGAPATEARRMLGAELAMTEAELRGSPTGAGAPGAVAANVAAMTAALDGLKPEDDSARRALAEAQRLYGEIGEARLLMALPPADPVSWPLVLAELAWSCVVFGCLGALSRAHAAAVAPLTLGALAAASAIWLGLELSQPLSGLFRLSPAPIAQVLMEVAQ